MAYKDKNKLIQYNNEYSKSAYDRITIFVPKGQKDTIKALAAEKEQSVNEYIKQAIKDRAKIDGHNIDL